MLVECVYCGKEMSDGQANELKKGEFCCDKCLDEAEKEDNIKKHRRYLEIMEKKTE